MSQFRNIFDSNPNTVTPSTTSTSSTATTITSSSTSTSRYTHPGVFCEMGDLEAIKQAYESNIGSHISVTIAHYIELLLAQGMQPEVILQAIQETGWARRPSPQYMRAILERYRLRGIQTMQQLLYDQQEFAKSREWWENGSGIPY